MNTAQKLALSIGILGFVASGGTQLTDIFAPLGSLAPVVVKEIVSLAGFASGVMGIVLTFTTGQGSMVKEVLSMPGTEKILVNEKANATMATLAVSDDPALAKISPTPAAENAVQATAAAAS